jgi:riboflavin biosynthesis pyrimidine reductase
MDLWDIWHCFIAPKLMGIEGIDVFAHRIETMTALNTLSEVSQIGDDVLIDYRNHGGVIPCLPE